MLCFLLEESSSFMRKGSIESLKKYWLEVRQNLTQGLQEKKKRCAKTSKENVA